MNNHNRFKVICISILILLATTIIGFAAQNQRKEIKEVYMNANEIKEKVVLKTSNADGILKKSKTDTESYVVKPSEKKETNDQLYSSSYPQERIERTVDGKSVTLVLINAEEVNRPLNQEFTRTYTNIVSEYYKDNKCVEKRYSLNGTDNNVSIQVDPNDFGGFSGTLNKVEGTGKQLRKDERKSEFGYDYVLESEYQADFSGTLSKTGTTYIGHYEGTYWTDELCSTKFIVTYAGKMEDNKLIHTMIGSTTEHFGDPVDVVTGNFIYNKLDMQLDNVGFPMMFMRTYNSRDHKSGMMGLGWTTNWDVKLQKDGSDYIFNDFDGKGIILKQVGSTFKSTGTDNVELEFKNGDAVVNYERIQYVFDSSAALKQIIDAQGLVLNVTSENGKIKEVTSKDNSKLKFTYANGVLSSVEDHNGKKVIMEYNTLNQLIKVTNPLNEVTTFEYDNNYLSKAYSDGVLDLTNTYDEIGRVIKQLDDSNAVHTFNRDDENESVTYTTSTTGESVKYAINERYQVTQLTYKDQTTETYKYDNEGRKIEIKNRENQVVKQVYDDKGNLKESFIVGKEKEKSAYNYDEQNRIKNVIVAGRILEEYEYNIKNQLIKRTEFLDEKTSAVYEFKYDEIGRIIEEINPLKVSTKYEYEGFKKAPKKIVNPEGNVVEFIYDAFGRVTQTKDASGQTQMKYDTAGNIIESIDKEGNVTTLKYDAKNRLIEMIKPEQAGTNASYKYEYDEKDQKIKETDPLGNVNRSIYNGQGELIKVILPEEFAKNGDSGNGVGFEYDKDGRLVKQNSPTGSYSEIKYDEVTGRAVEKFSPLNTKLTPKIAGQKNEYDDFGRISIIRDGQNRVIRKNIYNEFNQLVKVISANGYAFADQDEQRYGVINKYNYSGWLLETRVPKKVENGIVFYQIIKNEYDLQGRVLAESTGLSYVKESELPTTWRTVNNIYDTAGRLIKVTDTTGSEANYKYDTLGRVIEKKEKVIDQIYKISTNEYSPNGNLLKETVKSWSGDLKSRESENITTAYEYDKNSNCIKVTSPEGRVTQSIYNANNQVTQVKRSFKQVMATQNISKAILTAKLNQVMPGQNINIDLNVISRVAQDKNSFKVTYDSSVLTYMSFTPSVAAESGVVVEVEELAEGQLLVKTNGLTKDQNANLACLTFVASEQLKGQTLVKLSSESYMEYGGTKKPYDLLEGFTVYLRGPDLNRDGQVKVDDLSIIGKQIGKTVLKTKIEKMADLNADGTVTDDDLEVFKNWVFDENEKNLTQTALPTENTRITNIAPTLNESTIEYVINYEYDRNGSLIGTTDNQNNSSKTKFDTAGNTIEESDSKGNVSRYEYLVDGVVSKVSRNSGQGNEVVQYEYDQNGQAKAIKNGEGKILEQTTYNLDGSTLVEKQGNIEKAYVYDLAKRPTQITESSGNQTRTTQMTYNVSNQVTEVIDPKGAKTTYKYDDWGNPIEVTDALNNTTRSTFDKFGRLRTVTDAKNQTFEYAYTVNGSLKMVKYPDGKVIQYLYDKDGNQVEKINKDNSRVQYKYNDLSQLVSETAGQEQNNFSYSADGRVLSAWNNNAFVENKYNDTNQLVEKIQNGSLVTALTYDNYGKTKTETDAFGHKRSYAYNGDALSGISVDGKQNVAFTHNMYGQLTNATYENGQSLDLDYGSFNRVEAMKWQQNGKTIDQYAYDYDANGNIVKETTKNNTIGYEYDNVNRLVRTSSTKQFEETYVYDSVGNRTEKTTNGIKTTYKYGVGNRLLEALTGNDKTSYGYDDCGRMTTETGKGFSRTYAYDGFNKLAQINNEKGIQQNIYDPFGQRIGLVENGQTTQFDYGTDGLLTESIDNAPERAYFGSNMLKNQIDVDGNNYYGIYNVHGDMTYLMSGTKQLNTYTYSPFGETLSVKEGIPNRFRYSGEAQDSLTGDYYLSTRFYDPSLGRFTQEDNFLGDGFNLYAYVGNNPVNYVDPSGMQCEAPQLANYKLWTKQEADYFEDYCLKTFGFNLDKFAEGYKDGLYRDKVSFGKALYNDPLGTSLQVATGIVKSARESNLPCMIYKNSKNTYYFFFIADNDTRSYLVGKGLGNATFDIGTVFLIKGGKVVGEIKAGSVTSNFSKPLKNQGAFSKFMDKLSAGKRVGNGWKATDFAEGYLKKHFDKHVTKRAEWGANSSMTMEQYLNKAKNLLNSTVKGDIDGFVSKDGYVFRYNKATNEFATAKPDGTIETLFRPKEKLEYWKDQMEMWKPK